MEFSRRETIALGLGAVALTFMPLRVNAQEALADEAIAEFTGGADIGDGGVSVTAPEIAENGNTVPIAVAAPGAVSILLIAAGNPVPKVAVFNFGEMAAAQSASTRIRLAGTQDVLAIAKMADGSFVQASAAVKVTIGGCGG